MYIPIFKCKLFRIIIVILYHNHFVINLDINNKYEYFKTK